MKIVINALNPSSQMEKEKRRKIIGRLPFLHKDDGENENFSVAIYYDAWENDSDMDPVLSILYEITRQLNVDFSLSDKNIFKVVGAIFEGISGRNVNGIIETLSSDNPFKKFKAQKDIEDNIKTFFAEILVERGNRLVVFIDELDRCKPGFAICLLEQIKHYLCDDRITFVFSVNLEQLQHTVKHYYGSNFDSCRYLDRFFDLRITMPPANMDKFYNEIGLNSSYWIDLVSKKVIKMFNFELREITRFYAQVRAAVYKPIHKSGENNFLFPEGKGKQVILIYIVPLLIGLKLADISMYDNFINGKDGEPLRRLFSEEEENPALFNMIAKEESFVNEENKALVSQEEIVDRFYNAIFVNKYTSRNYSTRLGEYEFTKDSKNFAINTSSMLSVYAFLA